jgi:hypothetical protein
MLDDTTRREAEVHAAACRARGRTATLATVRLLVNGYEPDDRRSEGTMCYAVRAGAMSEWPVPHTLTIISPDWRDPASAVYTVDDGTTVGAWYVAGYSPTIGPLSLYLHPYPVHDPARSSAWMLPRRASYHMIMESV